MRPWVELVFAASLLLSCELQGPSAVTPVSVQNGGDVLLNVDDDFPESLTIGPSAVTPVSVQNGGDVLLNVDDDFPESLTMGPSAVTPVSVQNGGDVLLNVDDDLPESLTMGPSAVTPVSVQNGGDVLLNVDDDLPESSTMGPSAVTPVSVQNGGDVLLNVDDDLPESSTMGPSAVTLVSVQNGGDVLLNVDDDFPESLTMGPSAVTPVFVQKGGDVLLKFDAAVPEGFVIVQWNVNKTTILRFIPGREPLPQRSYVGRLEFPEKKYSVKLKNLQVADRGVYTACLLSDEDRKLAQYNVIVQDPVSPVELSVISVDYRSSECNLTVICRTQDSHINSTFRCDNKTCSQEGGERSEVTTSGASLRIYLLNGSMICTHSNQVSGAEDIKLIEHACLQPDDSVQHASRVTVTAVSVLVVIFVVAVLLGLFSYHQRRKNYNKESIENTVYEIPQIETTAPASGLLSILHLLLGGCYATVETPARSLSNKSL